MDKSIKLPLFLGTVCLVASAALAGVNALTAPIIEAREEAARMAGYLTVLGLDSGDGYTMSDVITAEGDLADSGITDYVYFLDNADDSLFGAVYNGEVSGYDSGIKFQVGISDGKYAGYNNIANNETSGYGKVLLTNLNDIISGIDIGDQTALDDALGAYLSANSLAATFTRNGISAPLVAAGVHYTTLEDTL